MSAEQMYSVGEEEVERCWMKWHLTQYSYHTEDPRAGEGPSTGSERCFNRKMKQARCSLDNVYPIYSPTPNRSDSFTYFRLYIVYSVFAHWLAQTRGFIIWEMV